MRNDLVNNADSTDVNIEPAHHEFRNLMHHFWNMADFPLANGTHSLEPKIEVQEKKDSVEVMAELPGVEEKDIDLQISSDGFLTLTAEKNDRTEEKSKNNYFSEISYGMVRRTVPLPWDLAFDKTEATFDNGVLSVNIPKTQTEQQRMKKIAVKKSRK